MVSRELDFSRIQQVNEDNLQTFLEVHNPSYTQARELYNQLIRNTANPLVDRGLSTNKDSFIILLLEKILRNTDLLVTKNTSLEAYLNTIGKEVFDISIKGLETIITAGNKITIELEKFEEGFKVWNTKFDKFSALFETWDLGFKTLEDKFRQIENLVSNYSKHYNNTITTIETELASIETHLNQWKGEIVRINDNFQQTEDNYIKIFNIANNLQQIEDNYNKLINGNLINLNQHLDQIKISLRKIDSKPSTSTPTKQIFQTIPSNNHNFKF